MLAPSCIAQEREIARADVASNKATNRVKLLPSVTVPKTGALRRVRERRFAKPGIFKVNYYRSHSLGIGMNFSRRERCRPHV
jgi:hypothetical protein